MILQQDNAPAHRSRAVRDFLLHEDIPIMEPWPAVSPDMNPIEHLWDYMKRKMREQPPTQNSDELFELLTQIWDNI